MTSAEATNAMIVPRFHPGQTWSLDPCETRYVIVPFFPVHNPDH